MEKRQITNEWFEALAFDENYHRKEDHEKFLFHFIEWNLSGLKREIGKGEYGIQTFNPYYFSNNARIVKVNPEYAMKLLRTDPGIAVEIVPNRYLLVDGYHRLYRDIMTRKREFEVYTIPFEIQIKYISEPRMFEDVLEMAKKRIC